MNKVKTLQRCVEYAQRPDGKFNIWRRITVNDGWELVDVVKGLNRARDAVKKQQHIRKQLKKQMQNGEAANV